MKVWRQFVISSGVAGTCFFLTKFGLIGIPPVFDSAVFFTVQVFVHCVVLWPIWIDDDETFLDVWRKDPASLMPLILGALGLCTIIIPGMIIVGIQSLDGAQ
ncbi:hypothetical protein [Ponticaulis sp.]|uniref:hypothetical protein n=1 Tax=Ponticaulis sp. TaxID=2020902 RepID=UPI002618793B|nr:hypothetical protein [Ponticaulis sp.]MDF1678982.1 hypothetical protein [Ponticaulis sp.]